MDYTVVENGAEADGYTVTAEGDSGTIQPGENSMVSFENHKDEEPTGPAAKTGDGRELTLYSAIAVISAMTAAILLVLKKRVK